MIKYISSFFILLLTATTFLLSSCKKAASCDQEYTISGQVINGTNGKKFFNLRIVFTATDADFQSGKPAKQFKNLGSILTDSSGKFTFKYKCSDFPGNEINMNSDLFDMGQAPFEQDYQKIWYRSDLGTLNVQLKTSSPMNSNDTLFLWHRDFILNKSIVDTFFNLPNTYQLSFRTPPGDLGFFYGRGYTEFIYNIQKDGVKYSKYSSYSIVRGDPVIDTLTLYY